MPRVQGHRAVTDSNTVPDAAIGGKGLFKGHGIAPGREDPAGTDSVGNVFQFITGEYRLADGERVHCDTLFRLFRDRKNTVLKK